jgi:hypothetical protein
MLPAAETHRQRIAGAPLRPAYAADPLRSGFYAALWLQQQPFYT